MININLTRSDDSTSQIEECIGIIQNIEEVSAKEKEIVLNFRDLKWILPCSALLLSNKINEITKRGVNLSFIEPSEKKVKNYLIKIGFPFGENYSSITNVPIHHFGKGQKDNSTKIIEDIC